MNRCAWTGASELMWAYHDTEWGVPLHDEWNLEAAQQHDRDEAYPKRDQAHAKDDR